MKDEESIWDWILTDLDIEKVERIKTYRKIRELIDDKKSRDKLIKLLENKQKNTKKK